MNNKVNLFYCYSHVDEHYRDELQIHLAALRNNGLINEWHDRRIGAGDDLNEEIDKHMESAHIILLLYSRDFINSEACGKEVEKAMLLREEKQIVVIPVILRVCPWPDTSVSDLMAVPKDGIAISNWPNKDEAWQDVYNQIKEKVKKIGTQIKPIPIDDFIGKLLDNPISNGKLDELFVYPDISSPSDDLSISEREIDSEKLTELDDFGYQYILINGEEQSGKTSLSNILYLSHQNAGRFPVLINGKNISGKADIKELMRKHYNSQYSHHDRNWFLDIEDRILLIDDADEITVNNIPQFISSVRDQFKYVIFFIDEASYLSDWGAEFDRYSDFHVFSINRLGHRKRDQLIKKCITQDENTDFDNNNANHLSRLDKNTKHINTIIGSNIVPSFPVFIITIFNVVEMATPSSDLSQTSYGHCYHAMVVMNLHRAGIQHEDIDAYFNFLTQLAYFIFNEKSKLISVEQLEQFVHQYIVRFIVPEDLVKNLERAAILNCQNGHYSFQYTYVFYYFAARYIARELSDEDVKQHVENLMLDIHKKDNANIIVFITHHTRDKQLLEEIISNAMIPFKRYPAATLSGDEKKLIKELSKDLEMPKHRLPDDNHEVNANRVSVLQTKDEFEPIKDNLEDQTEQSSDPLVIELRKSVKNIEIIGQILRNQYGSLEKDTLKVLFEEGQLVGLRLLRSFIEFMREEGKQVEEFFNFRLEELTKGESLTTEEKTKISRAIVSQFFYGVITGCLHKIVNSLGYDKHIDIADAVNKEQDSVASSLINLSIHAWYTKKLDIHELKRLYIQFVNDNNEQAIYILKGIVSHYIYMHPISFKDKQKINSLLGFSVKNQVSIQSSFSQNG